MNKKVDIEIIKAHELDPRKNYIIEVDVRSGLSHDDIRKLHRSLERQFGFRGVIVMTKMGDQINVKEVPAHSHADIAGHGNDDWPEVINVGN